MPDIKKTDLGRDDRATHPFIVGGLGPLAQEAIVGPLTTPQHKPLDTPRKASRRRYMKFPAEGFS